MSTNYFDTLITLAPDSSTPVAIEPPAGKPSVASQQYALISSEPYAHTSDDVIFARVAEKEAIPESDRAEAQAAYFEKGRPCLRTSPLPKQFGWGIHADAEGRVALVAADSDRYAELLADDSVKKIAAMRRSR